VDLLPCAPSFKPILVYNPSVSVSLKPTKQFGCSLFNGNLASLFKRKNVAKLSTPSSSPPRVKSATLERLKNAETNYLLMEDIDDMEENTVHHSTASLAHLQRKYTKNRRLSTENSSETPTRPLKYHIPPTSEEKTVQEAYLAERMKETHELTATLMELVHLRANLARQAYECLWSQVKVPEATPAVLEEKVDVPKEPVVLNEEPVESDSESIIDDGSDSNEDSHEDSDHKLNSSGNERTGSRLGRRRAMNSKAIFSQMAKKGNSPGKAAKAQVNSVGSKRTGATTTL